MPQLSQITLAILAGGAGTRMGQPKSRLIVRGKPILQYLLERWQWPGPTMLVTAPGFEYPPGHELFTREVADAVAGEGPLRGILTALENSASPVVVVITCDMPLVGREQLENTAETLQEHTGVLWRRPCGIEPFPSAYDRRRAIDVIASRIERRELSVRRLADERGFVSMEAPPKWDESIWLNLNTPADYDHFIQRFSSSDRKRP